MKNTSVKIGLLVLFCVFVNSCFLFDYESDRALKVKKYFGQFIDLRMHDMWHGSVGSNLPVVKKSEQAEQVQIMAHTIQCSTKRCYDTFKEGGKPILFSVNNFKEVFKKRYIAYVVSQGSDECGLEYLAFDRRLALKDYKLVLQALAEMGCEPRVVTQVTKSLPPWPKMKPAVAKRVEALKSKKGKQRSKGIDAWLREGAKECRFIANYRSATVKGDGPARREALAKAFADPQLMAVLDGCSLQSSEIMLLLRLHAFGVAERSHELRIKPFAFAATAQVHLKIDAKLASWQKFADAVYAHKAAEPIIGF